MKIALGPAPAVVRPGQVGLSHRWGEQLLCSPSWRSAPVPLNECASAGEGLWRTDDGRVVYDLKLEPTVHEV